jgi:hypothetical protein
LQELEVRSCATCLQHIKHLSEELPAIHCGGTRCSRTW